MKFKHPLIRAALATLWYSVATFIVLAAILVSMARLLLPLAADYKTEAEQLVSRYAGQTVRISALRAEWNGLGPELRLEDVRLYDAEGKKVRLQFTEARIGIDIFSSVLRQDFVPSSLTISGVQLSFTRHEDGSVSVHGLTDTDGVSESHDDYSRLISAWLFRQPEIGVTSSSLYWSDEKSGVKDLFFTDVYLRLRNDDIRHQIEGSLVLPEHLGKAFAFAIDLQGDLLDPRGWVGELYMKGRGFALPEWWPRDISKEIGLADGVASFELWGSWAKGDVQNIEGNLDATSLAFSGSRGKQLPLTGLASEFAWRRLEDGWAVQLNEFSPGLNQQAWPASQLSLRSYTDEERYELSAGFVRVGDVLSAASLFGVIDEKRHAPLFGLKPQADLSKLLARYSPRNAPGQRLHLESDFTGLTTSPWRELPAAINVSGHIVTDLEKGHVKIDSTKAELDYRSMFRDKLALDRLRGDVYWQRTDAGWQVDAPGLQVSNRDISLDTRLSMLLPDTGAPFLDLVSYFREGDGRQKSKYLPVAVIPGDAVTWLDRAIVDGYVPSGGLVVYGPLDKFPFDNGEGKFEVRFDVKNGVLDYQKGWPVLSEVEAEVVFSGRGMQVNGKHARILESTVKDIQVEFVDMSADIPQLNIHGLMDVQTADVLNYVVQSGIGKEYNKTLQRLDARGRGELELALELSLGWGEDHLSGRMRFDNNTIALRGHDVAIQALNGQVSVVDGQFRGEALHGQLQGAPLDIRVEPGEQKDVALNIEARTRLDLNASLRKQLGKDVPDLMPGTTDWLLQIQIPDAVIGQKQEAKFALSSDLQGVSVAAPAPLGKTAKQQRPFTVLVGVGEKEDYLLTLSYGDILNAMLEMNPDFSLQRGELALGRALSGLPVKPGLAISGRAEQLSVDEWQAYAMGLGLIGDKAKVTPSAGMISALQLEVAQLQAFDMVFKQVSLGAHRAEEHWLVDIRSDRLAGQVTVHEEFQSRPLKVDLAYLKLQHAQENSKATKHDPRDFPNVNLHVEQLFLDGIELGKFSAKANKTVDGLFVEQALLEGEHVFLSATGEWAVVNNEQTTRLQAKLKSEDFSQLLDKLGYESAFAAGRIRSVAQVQWPGSPMQFSTGKLDGNLSLDIRKGQILDVSPGAGRVFGLLSLQTLPRRLTLDFSDVFKKGFTFDRIDGSFLLERGDAYTTNLYLEGPAARIDISGRTGLANKDYDQLVTVTPNVTASLPLAGALVGGPVAGGVLYAIDKLFKKTIDKISQYQYTITGSWDEPKIVKLADGDTADAKTE